MGRSRDRVSLHERIHGAPPPSQPEPRPEPAHSSPPIRHCWVTDESGRLPGLLLEWRRTVAGWQGRVVRPVLEHGCCVRCTRQHTHMPMSGSPSYDAHL
jgi:hypothetical protein